MCLFPLFSYFQHSNPLFSYFVPSNPHLFRPVEEKMVKTTFKIGPPLFCIFFNVIFVFIMEEYLALKKLLRYFLSPNQLCVQI